MIADKVSAKDIKNFALGFLEVKLPDYQACRTAMSLVTYTKDTWKVDENGPKPEFESTINKAENIITIRLVKN